MSKTVILTGTALVSFRKVIRGCDEDDIAALQDPENQECNIDDSDLGEITEIQHITMTVTP